jgi:hypothetical protein
MIILGIQVVCLLVQVALLAATEQHRRKAKDAALRAGIAVVMARQSAQKAEEAAGMVGWPEGQR